MNPRPTYYDDEVQQKLVDVITKRVVSWMEQCNKESVDPETELAIKDEINDAICCEDDNYVIMRTLEDTYMLEDVASERHRIHRDATAAWVRDNSIAPVFYAGTRVAYMHNGKRCFPASIVSIDKDVGMYVVLDNSGSTMYVPYESVSAETEGR